MIDIVAASGFLVLILAVPYVVAQRKGRSGVIAVLLTLLCWPVGYLWAIFCHRSPR